MDRAAKLAAEARQLIFDENPDGHGDRLETRAILVRVAEDLGFAPNEISAAIDQALTDAGVGP